MVVFSFGAGTHSDQAAGVALEIIDGGVMDGIVASDITMDGVGVPIFIRPGNRARTLHVARRPCFASTMCKVLWSVVVGPSARRMCSCA